MLSITPDTVFYVAAFGGAIALLGLLVAVFIYYSDWKQKHKHA